MFDPISLLIQVAIAVVINVVAYVLMPKPKGPKPEAVTQLESPTVSAGKPFPVIFGTVLIKDPNICWFGEKGTNVYEVNA